MNPTIWGPGLWRILSDVAYHSDLAHSTNKTHHEKVVQFFRSLQYLLPCRYCRDSYSSYINTLPPHKHVSKRQALGWVFTIHELVNDKLRKTERLSWELYVQRMATWTRASSVADVWDFCFIVGINMKTTVSSAVKEKWLVRFHELLPEVYPNMSLKRTLSWGALTYADVRSADKYLQWLYKKRVKYATKCCESGLPPLPELLTRYENARAQRKTQQLCGPVSM
jgi:hypothetical protein